MTDDGRLEFLAGLDFFEGCTEHELRDIADLSKHGDS